MHFYWRIIEELKELGETWTIHDPGLLRCYRRWCWQNREAIELWDADPGASQVFRWEPILPSLN